MHVGRSYKPFEFFIWSRRSIFALLVISAVPVLLYELAGIEAISIPWTVVLMLGTSVALIAGFKNTQTYSRHVDAQKAWSSIVTGSRLWSGLSCDFLDKETARRLIYRHIAWLTALRYALRRPKPWETVNRPANAEYKKLYMVHEQGTLSRDQIAPYASPEDADSMLAATNPAARALQLQATDLKTLLDAGKLTSAAYLEMLKTVRDLTDQQSHCERIKNFPYPRQYAVISALFVAIFCLLLPFGMIDLFEQLNGVVDGAMTGYMVWLVIPFSVLIGWMYTSMDQVGENTSNPFEGGANDVPISQISRGIEIELRERLGETNLPAPIEPTNGIAT